MLKSLNIYMQKDKQLHRDFKICTKKKGFTLIELLIVIAILALLLTILLPTLNSAREQGKRAVCLSNVRSLFTLWNMYCSDNGGKMPDAWALSVNIRGEPPADTYSWVYSPREDATRSVQEKAIRLGKLFKYANFVNIYKCPTAEPRELVTYSIVITMGGHVHECVTKEFIHTKKDSVPFPSERLVFLDEGKWPGSPWGLHLPKAHGGSRIWWDQPTIRHMKGTNWGFADGHAVYRRWQDQATIEFCQRTDVNNHWCNVEADGSETDYDWLGHNIFGGDYKYFNAA